jgi:hypothetical protein
LRRRCFWHWPSRPNSAGAPRFTWWDHKGTSEWLQYDFRSPWKVSRVRVYWFDDRTTNGGCRVPASWKLLYQDGDAWKAVKTSNEFGTTREMLAAVAVKNHANGARDPYAHFQNEITVEDVLKSAPVCHPLHLLDCCPQTDGAAAVLVDQQAGPAGLDHRRPQVGQRAALERLAGALDGLHARQGAARRLAQELLLVGQCEVHREGQPFESIVATVEH